jgi:hypothetical protein
MEGSPPSLYPRCGADDTRLQGNVFVLGTGKVPAISLMRNKVPERSRDAHSSVACGSGTPPINRHSSAPAPLSELSLLFPLHQPHQARSVSTQSLIRLAASRPQGIKHSIIEEANRRLQKSSKTSKE